MHVGEQDRSSELVQLMMKYQRRIFAYIHTLVPSRSDAEDILQEASLTICEKFSDFKLVQTFIHGLAKLPIGKCVLPERNSRLQGSI